MGGTIIFALALLAISLALALWHLYERRGALTETDAREIAFLTRQFRRRLTTSALLALVGAALLGTVFLTQPLALGFLWLTVLGLLLGACLLAFFDWSLTRAHYLRSVAQLRADEAVLRAQLKRLQDEADAE